MHALEEQLVAVHPFVGGLLQAQQLVGAQVTLVVGAALALEDRLRQLAHGLPSVPSKIFIGRSASGTPPSAVTSQVSCM